MNRFQGIWQEDMWLLAENRFQDTHICTVLKLKCQY